MLDPHTTLNEVIASLVSRLDAVQRRAFQEKMEQLDTARPGLSDRHVDFETSHARDLPRPC